MNIMCDDMPISVDEANVTDDIIRNLVTCPKQILNKRRTKGNHNWTWTEYKYDACSTDRNYKFSIRIKQHDELPNRFSVILIYMNESGSAAVLFRCNGPHSGDNDHIPEHSRYHTHILTANDWISNSTSNPSKREEAKYISLLGGIVHFINRCNISDPNNILRAHGMSCRFGESDEVEGEYAGRQVAFSDLVDGGENE